MGRTAVKRKPATAKATGRSRLRIVKPKQKPRKPFRMWSPNRPVRPDVDPLYLELLTLLKRDKRSTWDKADASGLSTTTIRNWQKNKVRRPAGVSLQLAARMLGRRIVLK